MYDATGRFWVEVDAVPAYEFKAQHFDPPNVIDSLVPTCMQLPCSSPFTNNDADSDGGAGIGVRFDVEVCLPFWDCIQFGRLDL